MIRKAKNNKRWSLRTLKQFHASLIVKSFNSDRPSLRELIFAAAVDLSGSINYAHQLFDQISHPDLFMYNTMIRGSANSPSPSKAIAFYTQLDRHLRPDNYTFPFILKACARISDVSLGSQFHAKVLKFGFESDAFARNSLISLHASCGDIAVAEALFDGGSARWDAVARSAMIAGYAGRGELAVARALFDETPAAARDLVSWNVMITGYAKRGDMECARRLFDEAPERDVVSWNALVSGYVSRGSHCEALALFEEMRAAGETADEVTMTSLLSACADSGALDAGRRIHNALLEVARSAGLSVIAGNAVIDMYAKCGSIDRAVGVFWGMRERDVFSWNSVIGGLAVNGRAEEALRLFDEMRKARVRPDEITFLGVLAACSHGGRVEEGRFYFNLMKSEYGIEPNVKHCGCMVDTLGRAGLLEEAFELIGLMGVDRYPIIWRALLGACRLHGNVKLAEHANRMLVKMGQYESGNYVLLANAYGGIGAWVGMENVRKMMNDRGVIKEAGCSLIEEGKNAIGIKGDKVADVVESDSKLFMDS
ncbi:Pentatricopeptide repeat-containing protein [Acorus calamus]|uniref:Pentatricopeptide repeat-containing protein n=1 Tax=Acorus calamus TaxID=4465 RepID=A0AAV9C2L1_ACOCL|nr:Pentatricopeptide repeat-containing protein [Acorus calamus]